MRQEEEGKKKGKLAQRHMAELFSSHAFEAMLVNIEKCALAESHPKVTVMSELVHEHVENARLERPTACHHGFSGGRCLRSSHPEGAAKP